MSLTAVVVGGNGQVASLLTPILTAAGHRVSAVIRDPAQQEAVIARGATPVVLDMERATPQQLAELVPEADVLLFLAGAGPGSGPARKDTVDKEAALITQRAARSLQARVIQLSYIGVEHTPLESRGADFLAYQQAKYAADLALQQSALPWVIVRPSRLTDAAGTSKVLLGEGLSQGLTSRANTAAVLAGIVERPELNRVIIDVLDGEEDVSEALGGWRSGIAAFV